MDDPFAKHHNQRVAQNGTCATLWSHNSWGIGEKLLPAVKCEMLKSKLCIKHVIYVWTEETVITEQSNNHNNQDIFIIFCQLLVSAIPTQMCQKFDIVNGSIEVTYKVNNCFPTKGGLMKDMDFPGYRILI